MLKKVGWHLFN